MTSDGTTLLVIDVYQADSGEWYLMRYSPSLGDARSVETYATPDNAADAYFHGSVTWEKL